MKRIIILIIFVLLMLLILTGCSSKETNSDKEIFFIPVFNGKTTTLIPIIREKE